MKICGRNKTLIFILINLVLFINLQYYFCNSAPVFHTACAKKITAKADPGSRKTPADNASIVDEDETSETELHPGLFSGIPVYNFNSAPGGRSLALPVTQADSLTAFEPPIYLRIGLFLI